jgi:hypothetical protein
MSVSLATFEEVDRRIIERLYTELCSILARARPDGGEVDGKALVQHCRTPAFRLLMRSMKIFGQATYAARPDPDLRKVMHDIRGGPLAVMLLRMQTVGDTCSAAEAARLYRLANEHLELMRACVSDIDTVVSALDGSRAGDTLDGSRAGDTLDITRDGTLEGTRDSTLDITRANGSR